MPITRKDDQVEAEAAVRASVAESERDRCLNPAESSSPHPGRRYKYYDLVMAAFVTVLLCSNIIGVSKRTTIGNFTFGTGVLFFPISYLFGDILTEVYGYARSRRVIWAGFGALVFASLMSTIIVAMPPAKDWPLQDAYRQIFGQTPRIALASLIAFWAGEFANSFVLAKLKIGTEGRFLWVRTIGSTIAGEAVDSLLFYPLAFLGINLVILGTSLSLTGWDWHETTMVMRNNYLMKVGWEVLMTPLTYRIVNFLKRIENEDYYDRDTNFNPFALET